MRMPGPGDACLGKATDRRQNVGPNRLPASAMTTAPRSRPHWPGRIAWLLCVAAAASAILLPPLRQARLEARGRACLLALQEGLQRYVVREEIYPRRTPLSGAELSRLLLGAEHIAAPPVNPVTARPYAPEASDSPEPDWVEYRTDELAETYSLRLVDPSRPERPLLELDSTTHQSLE